MMRKTLLLTSLVLLCACSEKPQTAGGAKQDQAAVAGTGVASFTNPEWKAGDKTSWEQALKARQQYGMNEYSRAAPPPAVAVNSTAK
jgi:hypothetical protein